MGAEPITKEIVEGWSGELSQVQEWRHACANGRLAIQPQQDRFGDGYQ